MFATSRRAIPAWAAVALFVTPVAFAAPVSYASAGTYRDSTIRHTP